MTGLALALAAGRGVTLSDVGVSREPLEAAHELTWCVGSSEGDMQAPDDFVVYVVATLGARKICNDLGSTVAPEDVSPRLAHVQDRAQAFLDLGYCKDSQDEPRGPVAQFVQPSWADRMYIDLELVFNDIFIFAQSDATVTDAEHHVADKVHCHDLITIASCSSEAGTTWNNALMSHEWKVIVEHSEVSACRFNIWVNSQQRGATYRAHSGDSICSCTSSVLIAIGGGGCICGVFGWAVEFVSAGNACSGT